MWRKRYTEDGSFQGLYRKVQSKYKNALPDCVTIVCEKTRWRSNCRSRGIIRGSSTRIHSARRTLSSWRVDKIKPRHHFVFFAHCKQVKATNRSCSNQRSSILRNLKHDQEWDLRNSTRVERSNYEANCMYFSKK